MNHTRLIIHRRWLVASIVFLMVAIALFMLPVKAQASPEKRFATGFTPVRPPAEPTAPQVSATGIFTVNSALDTNVQDSVLTLREAILLANGGTIALGHLLTNLEAAQTGGTCSLSGSSNNWGLTFCGTNMTDTIHFSLASGTVIAVGPTALNVINDTAPTIIDGIGHVPVIDLSGIAGLHNGIRLTSSYNTVQNIDVENAGLSNFYIDGNYNTLYGVRSYTAGRDGIEIIGDHNTVSSSRIGLTSAFLTACNSPSKGNGIYGLRLAAGSQYNTVTNTYIGCNSSSGVAILASATAGYHNIGPNNGIGVEVGNYDTGNGGYGIDVNTDWNSIFSNTVSFNSSTGIHVTGDSNQLYGNEVESNGGDGIQILATNNLVGCKISCLFGEISANILSSNVGNGLSITGTGATNNQVFGNWIGLAADGFTNSGNTQSGILVYGGGSNLIGTALGAAMPNRIAWNTFDGIRLDNGTFGNAIAGNSIYNNNQAGVRVINGSNSNTIGGAPNTDGNHLSSNGIAGIWLNGSTVRSNIIDSNIITTNTIGVRISGSAHDNLLGSIAANKNLVMGNIGDGVLMDTFAYSNTVGHNYIGMNLSHFAASNGGNGVSLINAYNNFIGHTPWDNEINYNLGNGILISGTSSYGNFIAGNDILDNHLSGVRLESNAHDNQLGTSQSTNYMASNLDNGIMLLNSNSNTMINNDVAFNGRNGIELNGAGTTDNYISLGTIRNNTLDGINERHSAAYNRWLQVSIFKNGGLGIDKNAPVDAQNNPTGPMPTITNVSSNGANVTLSGTATPSSGTQTVYVELYLVDINAMGYSSGDYYLTTVLVGNNGKWTYGPSASQPSCYTAFQTVYVPGNFTRESSEFSANSCRVMLPLIMRSP